MGTPPARATALAQGSGSPWSSPRAAAITLSATLSHDHRSRTVATSALARALPDGRVAFQPAQQPLGDRLHRAGAELEGQQRPDRLPARRAASAPLTSASPEWAALTGSAPQAAASAATIPKASGKVLGTTSALQAGKQLGELLVLEAPGEQDPLRRAPAPAAR